VRTLLSSAPDVVRPSSVVRDLCVVDIEAELTQQQHLHVNWLVRSAAAFPPRSTSAAEPAARQTSDSVSVISRLDYCNSVLAGLPAQYLRQMHRVQNAAARPILKLKPRDHITPALRELHWLFTREVESAIQALSADAPCHYGTLSCVPIRDIVQPAIPVHPKSRAIDSTQSTLQPWQHKKRCISRRAMKRKQWRRNEFESGTMAPGKNFVVFFHFFGPTSSDGQ